MERFVPGGVGSHLAGIQPHFQNEAKYSPTPGERLSFQLSDALSLLSGSRGRLFNWAREGTPCGSLIQMSLDRNRQGLPFQEIVLPSPKKMHIHRMVRYTSCPLSQRAFSQLSVAWDE